jgi:peptidoglycan/LPS O-acetylase OafA/YrhL
MRAVAVTCVCLSHILGGPSAALDLGSVGVRVFFVLSGFLITTLLLAEWQEHQTINLRRFYFRRAMRIFPAYYAYLAAIAIAGSLGWIELHHNDLRHAMTYTVNYFMPVSSPFVQQAWSLAVEEQFYLLWPVVLLLVGKRRGLHIAVLYLCLAPFVRVAVHESLPDLVKGTIRYRFETVADALAAGCVLAGYRAQLWDRAWYRRLISSTWFWLIPVGVLVLATVRSHAFQALVGVSLMNIAIAVILDRCMRMPAGPVGRVLNTRVLTATGVLSYSIYLWQQPFLATHRAVWWTRFPTNIALTIVAALVSYLVIERPFLALRQRITATAGTARSATASLSPALPASPRTLPRRPSLPPQAPDR